MINRVVLVGRLTKDPELRFTSSNIAVVSFTLAVNRNFTTQDGKMKLILSNVLHGEKLRRMLENMFVKVV